MMIVLVLFVTGVHSVSKVQIKRASSNGDEGRSMRFRPPIAEVDLNPSLHDADDESVTLSLELTSQRMINLAPYGKRIEAQQEQINALKEQLAHTKARLDQWLTTPSLLIQKLSYQQEQTWLYLQQVQMHQEYYQGEEARQVTEQELDPSMDKQAQLLREATQLIETITAKIHALLVFNSERITI